MDKHAVKSAAAPEAIGPYSQAIRSGPWLFLSGQIGLDPKTKKLVEGGIEAQARQIFRNIEAILSAAGLGFSQVVKTTIFLKEMSHFNVVNTLYAQFFPEPFPARSTVAVAGLPLAADIEMEVIAAD